jgi:hypothetical protein
VEKLHFRGTGPVAVGLRDDISNEVLAILEAEEL